MIAKKFLWKYLKKVSDFQTQIFQKQQVWLFPSGSQFKALHR